MLHPSRWQAWWLALRPRTLSLAATPVLAASALVAAQGHAVSWAVLAAALLAALCIQVAVNLFNDVGDFERGTDTAARLGPPRATAQGWLRPQAVRRGAWLALGLALALGTLLVARGGWPIAALGLASLLAAWAYTSGPLPLAWWPVGELCAGAFFGPLAVWGMVWLHTGQSLPGTLALGLALGAFAAAVLLVNNTRDAQSDTHAGRRTLAVFLGLPGSRAVYALLLALPFALLPRLQPATAWPLLALPVCIALAWRMAKATPGPLHNRLLAATAQSQALYAALWSAAALGAPPP